MTDDKFIERRISTVSRTPAEEDERQDQRDLHISLLVSGAVKEAVTEAVAEAVLEHMPTKEESEFLALAVRRAARREKLQQAIIEKSLTGLVWAGLIFVGVVFYDYIIDHGWKP